MTRNLKKEIKSFLIDQGADLVGFASIRSWTAGGMVPESYRPDSLWPHAKSVIVIGCQMPLPIVETTPSVQHRDLYNTCNRTLDTVAFSLSRWLHRQGQAAINLSRDGYANIHTLIKKPMAAFSHVWAAHYAGLGYIGINNTILTQEFGPRQRFVSVFTDASLAPDPVMKESLCIRCGACAELCPAEALAIDKKELRDKEIITARFDRLACSRWARLLTERGCYPCGICIKVCPVGHDRTIYGRKKMTNHYREEFDAPVFTSLDPFYRSWNHVRSHGSMLFDENTTLEDTLRDVFEKIKDNKSGRRQ